MVNAFAGGTRQRYTACRVSLNKVRRKFGSDKESREVDGQQAPTQ